MRGEGTEKNKEKAIEAWTIAANGGMVEAQRKLGKYTYHTYTNNVCF